MIVFLVNRFGEQLRVQLGSPRQALIVDLAVASVWEVVRTEKAGRHP